MKNVTILLLLGLMLGGAFIANAQAPMREEKPNAVGGELLGRGLILTVNYERYLSSHFGLGAGVMAIGSDDGSVIILPLYASFLSGNKHNLYLGAGVTIFSGGSDVSDYESETVTTLSVGYQFQADSGFYIRPLFTYLSVTDVDNGDSGLIWPGLAMGASF